MRSITVGDRSLGQDEPTFVIAEAGSNHNGDLNRAKELIDAAADAGADAVKFQTFRADRVYVEQSGQAEYLDDDRSLHDILTEMEMPYDWIPELHEHARDRDLVFMSTPADRRSADQLEPYMPVFKIESFMMSYHSFLSYVAEKGKPLIVSTGAHKMSEIREAVSHLKQLDEQEFVLLQCVSAYPTPLDDINVRVIERYREEFNVPTGLSDHTLDPTVAPTVATALGASIIEKHFTLDRTLDGPDHEFALEPDELDEMVSAVRRAERTLGSGIKEVVDAERELYKKARRYVQAVADIEAGDQLSENDIAVLAPGERRRGVDPKHYDEIVGKQAVTDIRAGQGVRWDDVE